MRGKHWWLSLTLLALSTLAIACAVNGPTAPQADRPDQANPPAPVKTGGLSVTVKWPEVGSRLVPAASQSVVFEAACEAPLAVLRKVLTPANPSATFELLPEASHWVMVATAYPDADGIGTPQAVGATEATIVAGTATPVYLAMYSTIAEVTVTLDGTSQQVGTKTWATATALDADGYVVLVPLNTWQWSTSNEAVAVATTETLVPGDTSTCGIQWVGGGSTDVIALEQESNVEGSATGAVNSDPTVDALVADPAQVTGGDWVELTCTASDPDGDSLTYYWSAYDGSWTAAGWFDGAGETVWWEAPDYDGVVTIWCDVEDTNGGWACGSVTVEVGTVGNSVSIGVH